MNDEVANILNQTPVFFICGTSDNMHTINQVACNMLDNAGNTNIEFVSIAGGHDYRHADVEAMYSWMRQFSLDNTFQMPDDPNDTVIQNPDTGMASIEVSTLVDIAVYPNPLNKEQSQQLQILNVPEGQIRLSFMDVQGRMWLKEEVYVNASQSVPLKTAGLFKGVYFLLVQGSRLSANLKILVQ